MSGSFQMSYLTAFPSPAFRIPVTTSFTNVVQLLQFPFVHGYVMLAGASEPGP